MRPSVIRSTGISAAVSIGRWLGLALLRHPFHRPAALRASVIRNTGIRAAVSIVRVLGPALLRRTSHQPTALWLPSIVLFHNATISNHGTVQQQIAKQQAMHHMAPCGWTTPSPHRQALLFRLSSKALGLPCRGGRSALHGQALLLRILVHTLGLPCGWGRSAPHGQAFLLLLLLYTLDSPGGGGRSAPPGRVPAASAAAARAKQASRGSKSARVPQCASCPHAPQRVKAGRCQLTSLELVVDGVGRVACSLLPLLALELGCAEPCA